MSEEIELLYQSKYIIIYGAQKNAVDTYLMLDYLFADKIIGFAVSSMHNNLEEILGVKVRTIDEYDKFCSLDDTCVIVAMRDILLNDVNENLCKMGYKNILLCGENLGIRKDLEEECARRFVENVNMNVDKVNRNEERYSTERICYTNVGKIKNNILREHLSNKLEEIRLNA